MNTIAERLRWARELGGISARRLDELADLTAGHSNGIESGRRQNPETKTVQKLVRVLGLSLDWLLNGVGEPPTLEGVRAAVQAVDQHKHCA